MSDYVEFVDWLKRKRLTDIDFLDMQSTEEIITAFENEREGLDKRYDVAVALDYTDGANMELWDYDLNEPLVRVHLFDDMISEPVANEIEEALHREALKLSEEEEDKD